MKETDLVADKIFSIIKNETRTKDPGLAAFLENQKPVE